MRIIVVDDNVYNAVLELKQLNFQDISDILEIKQEDIEIINPEDYRDAPSNLIDTIATMMGDVIICDMYQIPYNEIVKKALDTGVKAVILWSILCKNENLPEKVFGISTLPILRGV